MLLEVIRWRRRAVKTRVRRANDTGLVVLAALTVRWLILDAYLVPSGSMLPGLLIGDRLFVAKFVYSVRLPFTTVGSIERSSPNASELAPAIATPKLITLSSSRARLIAASAFAGRV